MKRPTLVPALDSPNFHATPARGHLAFDVRFNMRQAQILEEYLVELGFELRLLRSPSGDLTN
ncbi:hypothetical protein AVEN_157226-1, partial [Araneus ventricosus]